MTESNHPPENEDYQENSTSAFHDEYNRKVCQELKTYLANMTIVVVVTVLVSIGMAIRLSYRLHTTPDDVKEVVIQSEDRMYEKMREDRESWMKWQRDLESRVRILEKVNDIHTTQKSSRDED